MLRRALCFFKQTVDNLLATRASGRAGQALEQGRGLGVHVDKGQEAVVHEAGLAGVAQEGEQGVVKASVVKQAIKK